MAWNQTLYGRVIAVYIDTNVQKPKIENYTQIFFLRRNARASGRLFS